MKSLPSRRPLTDVVARTWDLWKAHRLLSELVARRKARRKDVIAVREEHHRTTAVPTDLPPAFRSAMA